MADAGCGPDVLSVDGLLVTARVRPGHPLRASRADLDVVLDVVRDLPELTLALAGLPVGLLRAAAGHLDGINDWLVDQRRSPHLVRVERCGTGAGAAHGDAQLGNLLVGTDRRYWIDAEPARGGLLADCARLLCHAWIDAHAAGYPWPPDVGIDATAELTGVDGDTLAVEVHGRAAATWRYISEHAPQRRWESAAALQLTETLGRTVGT
jgi:hypothetical protein